MDNGRDLRLTRKYLDKYHPASITLTA